jgi:hypothetical protein
VWSNQGRIRLRRRLDGFGISGFTTRIESSQSHLAFGGDGTQNHLLHAKTGAGVRIEQKIQSLYGMKRALQRLVSSCAANGPASQYSFLANLSERTSP